MNATIDKSTVNNLAVFANLIYTMFEQPHKYKVPIGYELVKTFNSEIGLYYHHNECIAAVFKKSETNEYFLSFRGTDSKWDVAYDAIYLQTDFYDMNGHHIENVKVHLGFYDMYTNEKGFYESESSLRWQLWSFFRDEIKFENVSKLYITGHSLGCGLATLFTYDLFCTGEISSPVIYYNFASPMVGNKAFCDDFISYVNNPVKHRHYPRLTMVRIVNSRDLVPRVPGLIDSNYEHIQSSFDVDFCWEKYRAEKPVGNPDNVFCLLKDLVKYVEGRGNLHEFHDESLRVIMCHSMDNYQYVCKHLDEHNHYKGKFPWKVNPKYTIESK